MKKAIITGPTGAIGIALINYLIKQNVEVTAVCRENSRRIVNIPVHPLVTTIECNLEQLDSLSEQLDHSYDVFYHFGWDGTFGDSRNNTDIQLKNIGYTLKAVEVAAQLGCHTFIGAGSQAEYGRAEGSLDGMTPTNPENGYGIAKLCAGQMSRLLCEQKGIKHIWTRILSIYGPYDGENTMIMSTIRKLMNGDHAAFTKAEQQWDYLYSMDAGKAMYLLGEKGISGKIYCIGSGKTRKLAEYIEILKNVIAPSAELGIGEINYADKQVMYLCANISDIQEDTGFTPDYEFEEGIEETINWYKERESK